MEGPNEGAASSPAKNSPGHEDSKPGPSSGALPPPTVVSAARSPASSISSRSRSGAKPVAAMTWATSMTTDSPWGVVSPSRVRSPTAAARCSRCPSSAGTRRSNRSRSHQAPAGPSAVAAMRSRVGAGSRRTAQGSSDHTQLRQPVPRPLCGSRRARSGGLLSGCGTVFQFSRERRATRHGRAPCSASRAAVSRAACPAPSTATSRPAKPDRSRWPLLCE